jgi:hypothetical protein
MWVTLERDPMTDEWARARTTQGSKIVKWAEDVFNSDTVWPLLVPAFLITTGVLSAVWINSHSDDIEVVSKARDVSTPVSPTADVLEAAAATEQIGPEKSVTNTNGEIVPNPPSANANFWLTISPPVNEYRSVGAGNWLSH